MTVGPRLASAAAVGAALSAFAASAPAAVFDETISCAVSVRGGIPVLDVGAAPTGWFFDGHGKRVPHAAQLVIGTSGQTGNSDFFALTSARDGLGSLHSRACAAAPKIVLSRSALPLYNTFTAPNPGLGNWGYSAASCFTGSRITARLRATVLGGRPVAALLAVRSGKKQRPIAFIDWTPKRVTVYFSDDCHE